MNEKPILFSGEMVKAILAGTKTQTRRMIKTQPPGWATFVQEIKSLLHCKPGWHPIGIFQWSEEQTPGEPLKSLRRWPYNNDEERDYAIPCPYGQRGDRLWVRETFGITRCTDHGWNHGMFRGPLPKEKPANYFPYYRATHNGVGNWRPSIHMPRWASRITLEITGVRVERLQDISRGDAMDEGCPFPNMAQGDDPRKWYADLWNSINGPGSWDATPWVWVIEFKRLT